MATIDDGEIFLEVPQGSRDTLEAALAAARRVFILRGVAPADALNAHFKAREGHLPTTAEEKKLAEVVEDAWEAAERAVERVAGSEPEWICLTEVVPEGPASEPALESDEAHYAMREADPLPQLPLGLPPIDPRLLDPRLASVL